MGWSKRCPPGADCTCSGGDCLNCPDSSVPVCADTSLPTCLGGMWVCADHSTPGCGGTPLHRSCNNCSTGFAPDRIKLVIPSGALIDPGSGGGPGNCPDPGCDFYVGTYFLQQSTTAQTAGCDAPDGLCCSWFLCFDCGAGDCGGVPGCPNNPTGCACQGGQTSADCAAFCNLTVDMLPPDGLDANYHLQVKISSGSVGEDPCGCCHFATGFTIWKKDFTTDPPDCESWSNLSLPQSFTFGSYCVGSGAAVLVSAA
jgi:hypothetical protein